MRPTFLDAPFEWFFALLMAASPIVGSIWVKPDPTFWAVFGVGVATSLAVILAGLRPSRAGRATGTAAQTAAQTVAQTAAQTAAPAKH